MEFGFLLAQVGGACTAPNPFEWIAIVALISGAGVLSIVTGTAVFSIGSTIVSMAISGASVSMIVAAITGDAFPTAGGTEALASLTALIVSIINILGC